MTSRSAASGPVPRAALAQVCGGWHGKRSSAWGGHAAAAEAGAAGRRRIGAAATRKRQLRRRTFVVKPRPRVAPVKTYAFHQNSEQVRKGEVGAERAVSSVGGRRARRPDTGRVARRARVKRSAPRPFGPRQGALRAASRRRPRPYGPKEGAFQATEGPSGPRLLVDAEAAVRLQSGA